MPSTLTRRVEKSLADSIACLPRETVKAWLDGLTPNSIASLPYLFDIWALGAHQSPPDGDWITWLILGGRGAGKTRAGSEWIRTQVEGPTPLAAGRRARVALVGQSIDEVVDIMVRGESGILACSPKDRRPRLVLQRKALEWPNGAEATFYSDHDPERLRGPQFDCAWADELGKWRNTQATWDMLQMCLRLGDFPQQVVTTTPRANPTLEALMQDPTTVVTSASTWANAANLADSFIKQVKSQYTGTAQGRRELEGEMVLDRAGALWTRELIDRSRAPAAPEMSRVIVAIDPPASTGARADECGMIVAGLGIDDVGYVLADLSSQGDTPNQWAARAVDAYHEYSADRIVAEVNQGGAMVETLVRQVDANVSYSAVHATRGKQMRAEPVSSLYEMGRVRHVGMFATLEDQMCGFGADDAPKGASPDRVDALVWAMTELLLTTRKPKPRARVI